MATTHREGSVVTHEGGTPPPVTQPGPAPGFSNTPAAASDRATDAVTGTTAAGERPGEPAPPAGGATAPSAARKTKAPTAGKRIRTKRAAPQKKRR